MGTGYIAKILQQKKESKAKAVKIDELDRWIGAINSCK